MARLRSRGRGVTTTSPYSPGGRYRTSHLEPASPAEFSFFSRGQSSPLSLSSLLALWPNRSLPSVVEDHPPAGRRKHIPIDISRYEIAFSTNAAPENEIVKPRTQARPPRHIPIIIPDHAEAPVVSISSSSPSPGVPRPPETGPASTSSIFPPEGPAIPSQLRDATSIAEHEQSRTESAVTMTGIQPHLPSPDTGQSAANGVPASAISASGHVGISPVVNQHAAGSGPTNLSGLVCNVHRTTGREPHPLVGATTTVLGDKLYVFGGRIFSRSRPHLTSDLYELDLIRRHWSKLDTTGDIPPPRYFHSMCALGDTMLVCYGGMSPAQHSTEQSNGPSTGSEPQPEVVVMSDIHIYDVLKREWTLVSHSDMPQGRYAHCATILPSSAMYTSADAPLSSLRHNPPSSDPHSGTLGVQIDGSGGAEMVVVGGQDSANAYIEQISVFNLRSLKWTAINNWDRKCGAYKSMIAPLSESAANAINRALGPDGHATTNGESKTGGSSMLIYSNYNFMDVKLELQIRSPDGSLRELPMTGHVAPPGLRFPNGGIIHDHFVVSGTFLTSSKHEYALWALDFRTMTWGRIDTNGTVFGQGSWNRGVLWNRRNTFVILGHRKRSMVDDYSHRRINFSHICLVELEAFGLYDNPRKVSPTSGYVSVSAPSLPASLQASLPSQSAGGRPYSKAAQQLGQTAMNIGEVSDMDLIAIDGERIPCNSHILSSRWGPYFNQILLESASLHDGTSISDADTLRPMMRSQASRNSSITITPSIGDRSVQSNATTLAGSSSGPGSTRTASRATARALDVPNAISLPPSSRPRALYLPHTAQTIHLMLQYLYTSSLPPVGSAMCTTHSLCSLLQMARPYQIDGLLEATVERLHEVLDGRNAAAVFNAAAMAAGGGRGLGQGSSGTLELLEQRESEERSEEDDDLEEAPLGRKLSNKMAGLRINTSFHGGGLVNGKSRGHEKADSEDSGSTATSASTSNSLSTTDPDPSTHGTSHEHGSRRERKGREVWTGGVSTVIGLQKRGLRGLMEGRRLRERGNTGPSADQPGAAAGG